MKTEVTMLTCHGKSLSNFFFQAEYGIRDIGVTGVQTCALPIFLDGLLELLGRGGAGLGVLDVRGGGGVLGGGQCSRLWSAGGRLRGALAPLRSCPGRVSRDQFQRRRGQQKPGRTSVSAREGTPRGVVSSGRQRTDTQRAEGLADSQSTVRGG